MKKILIVLLLCSLLSLPVIAQAQTQSELTQQLITLLTQTIQRLQQQVADILAQQAQDLVFEQKVEDYLVKKQTLADTTKEIETIKAELAKRVGLEYSIGGNSFYEL